MLQFLAAGGSTLPALWSSFSSAISAFLPVQFTTLSAATAYEIWLSLLLSLSAWIRSINWACSLLADEAAALIMPSIVHRTWFLMRFAGRNAAVQMIQRSLNQGDSWGIRGSYANEKKNSKQRGERKKWKNKPICRLSAKHPFSSDLQNNASTLWSQSGVFWMQDPRNLNVKQFKGIKQLTACWERCEEESLVLKGQWGVRLLPWQVGQRHHVI